MNIFEFLIFLFVTAAVGAAAGLLAGLVGGAGSKWAGPGALAGPVVVALGITLWLIVIKLRKSRLSRARKDETRI
jgi:hypothetical protein